MSDRLSFMNLSHKNTDRRQCLKFATGSIWASIWSTAGCDKQVSDHSLGSAWGRRGISAGRFQKPRAIAIDNQDRLYIVDTTARIQIFDATGNYQGGWRTPEMANGKPSGLSFDIEGNLMVADTHYFRVLFYKTDGTLLQEKTIGGTQGYGPGEFNFVTDAVQDSDGFFYVGEYGEHDRIQKFTPEGKFVFQWGSLGNAPGQFVRPQNLAIDKNNLLWIADACNHRIQVFDAKSDPPKLIDLWGKKGKEIGQLYYPYDLVLDGTGHVLVSEFGNHRIQKFTLDGRVVANWGVQGRRVGQLHNPWALSIDSRQQIHILDSMNHRVQTIRL